MLNRCIDMLQFLLEDPQPLLHHGEVILRNGEPMGYIRVGAYGHTLGAAVGLGMVEAEEPVTKSWVESGRFELEVAGKTGQIVVDPDVELLYRPHRG